MQFERLIFMLGLFKLRFNKIMRKLFEGLNTACYSCSYDLTNHHASSPPLTAPFHSFGLPKFNVNYEFLFNKLFPMGRGSQKKRKTKHEFGSQLKIEYIFPT